MRVLYVTKTKDRGYSSITIDREDERVRLVASDATITEMQIVNGSLLSEEDIVALSEEDTLYRIRKKALSILAYGDNSKRQLCDKLVRAGFAQGLAIAVSKEMEDCGYINEKRILERLIQTEVNVKCLGRGRIIPKLAAKGYKRSVIEEVIEILTLSGEIDFSLAKARLIEKRLGEDPDENEVKQLLYKYGHSSEF